VSEDQLDDFDRDAAGEQERAGAVPQVVQPNRRQAARRLMAHERQHPRYQR
jgi:hypothetical protein